MKKMVAAMIATAIWIAFFWFISAAVLLRTLCQSFICLGISGGFVVFIKRFLVFFLCSFLFLIGFGFGLGRMLGSVLGVRSFALV